MINMLAMGFVAQIWDTGCLWEGLFLNRPEDVEAACEAIPDEELECV